MKTIGILSNNQSPATDIYRSIHPFSLLGHEVIVIDPANAKWHDLIKCNILIASRPNGTAIYGILQEFKRMKDGNKIIGYLLAMTQKSQFDIPILIPMFKIFNETYLK